MPVGLRWDEMPDRLRVPATATLARRGAQRPDVHVRYVIDGLTERALDSHTKPVEGPGWPELAAT